MNLTPIIEQLRNELDALNMSILALERVAAGRGTPRGRPPKWIALAKNAAAQGRSKAPASVKKSAK
jgi:hypothetical protein